MKKKLVLGMLGCSLILGLSACGKEDESSKKASENSENELQGFNNDITTAVLGLPKNMNNSLGFVCSII